MRPDLGLPRRFCSSVTVGLQVAGSPLARPVSLTGTAHVRPDVGVTSSSGDVTRTSIPPVITAFCLSTYNVAETPSNNDDARHTSALRLSLKITEYSYRTAACGFRTFRAVWQLNCSLHTPPLLTVIVTVPYSSCELMQQIRRLEMGKNPDCWGSVLFGSTRVRKMFGDLFDTS